MIDDRQAVAERLGLFHVMRGVEHASAGTDLLAHQLSQAHAALGINADRRLVKQQRLGPMDDAAGEVEPALHATAEALDRLTRAIDKADDLEHLGHAALQIRSAQAVGRAPVAQVLGSGQILVQRQLLRDDAERGPRRSAIGHYVQSEHFDEPAARLEQA